MPPPVAETVIVLEPTLAPGATFTVIVDEPEPGAAIGVGLKLTVTPLGCPVAESAMEELNPPAIVVEIEEVLEPPCWIDRLVGRAPTVKSGGATPVQLF